MVHCLLPSHRMTPFFSFASHTFSVVASLNFLSLWQRSITRMPAARAKHFSLLGNSVIHMIPANWDRNAQDMASLWPNDGIPEAYSRLQGYAGMACTPLSCVTFNLISFLLVPIECTSPLHCVTFILISVFLPHCLT